MSSKRHDSFNWKSRPFRARRGTQPADAERFAERMVAPQFPRAAQYDPIWVYSHSMGPNVLWLTEWLSQNIELSAGMRILDLGCGTAVSSIFLAREFGVSVCAAELWVAPHDNWERVMEADLASGVFPMHAEAHSLPFAHSYFDAIVSVDAYHYFGTDERYLPYVARFVRPGGTLAIVVPGNAVDPEEMPPDQRSEFFKGDAAADFFTFRSAVWWKRFWSRSGAVNSVEARMLENGHELWLRWSDAGAAWQGGRLEDAADAPMLLPASGRGLGFTLVIAHRPE
ncbi:MAG TPA: methyltransferase domain-containing protein [Dehalococcoidia bacterium]|nr:methyltransferase domain-containing protein [Dehalococcoidia bacterium]